MSNPTSHQQTAWDPSRAPEPEPWITGWHIPQFLKRFAPRKVINALQQVKGRFLTRDFPRHIEFTQSVDDRRASVSISIIVPIHDAPKVTRRCLASLEKYAPESEIILVDDASKLMETRDVIQQFSNSNSWKVVHHEKSQGHSEACRAGTRLATRPYLCLLNSDTVVTPWCWRQIKEAFECDPTIGVAGPSTSNAGTPQAIRLAADLSPYWNDSQIYSFAQSLLDKIYEPMLVDLAWISGFAFFIRRHLWEDLGGFDAKLPDYGNEVELCRRVSDRGIRLVWVRNAYIHHFGQQSYLATLGDEAIHARIRAAEIYNRTQHSSLKS